jgi:hypothetical protein
VDRPKCEEEQQNFFIVGRAGQGSPVIIQIQKNGGTGRAKRADIWLAEKRII